MFVLKVIVQTQTLGRQMLADHRHPKVRAILSAKFLGQGKAEVTGLVGEALGFAQKLFPLVARQALIVPIGAGMFAAMVKEALIVVFGLKRLDLGLDERVEHAKIVNQFLG